MKSRKVVIPVVVSIVSFVFLQCSLLLEPPGPLQAGSTESAEAPDPAGPALLSRSMLPTAEESDETAANNLSVPVIWSDGVSLALPGDPGIESFLHPVPLVLSDDTVINVYPQQDPLNSWQAESFSPDAEGPDVLVDYIDWGDNLEAKNWPLGGKIRVETVLYKSFPGPEQGMKGYDMYFIEGQGKSESWGTSGVSRQYNHEGMEGYNALIYSGCAKLVIQKITGDTTTAQWDENGENGGFWIGDGIGEPIFNRGVWDSTAGDAGGYSAEINIGGKVIYGFNWDTRLLADGTGGYRITFALVGGSIPLKPLLNTMMDDSTKIFVAEEEVVLSSGEGDDSGEPDLGGGTAHVLGRHNLTYIDVQLTDKGGKGRK